MQNDYRLRRRKCNTAPPRLSASSNCKTNAVPEDKASATSPQPEKKKPLGRSSYKYRARWEQPWIQHISRQVQAFHMLSEEEDMQELTSMSLPAPSAEEYRELCSDDEGSSDESDAHSLSSSPQAIPVTPDTDLSSWPSPQVLEAAKFELDGDKVMSDADEDLQHSSTEDEVMDDSLEDLQAGTSEDGEMTNTPESLQLPIAEDVDMTITHDDDFTPGSFSASESNQDRAMEDASASSGMGTEVETPVQNTGFIFANPTSSKVKGVTPTFAVVSSGSLQSAMTGSQNVSTFKFGGWDAYAAGNVRAELPKFNFAAQAVDTAMTGAKLTSTVVAASLSAEALPSSQATLQSGQTSLPSFQVPSLSAQARLSSAPAASPPQVTSSTQAIASPAAGVAATPQAVPLKPQSAPALPASMTPALAQTINTSASHGEIAVTSQHADEHEQLDLDSVYMIGLLRQAQKHFMNQGWVSMFQDMFQLPWDDKATMKKVVKHVIKHPNWGRGSLNTAKTRIE